MLENLIVAVIVGASAWYAASKYLPAPWRKRLGGGNAGCGSGCDSCNSCADGAPATDGASGPAGRRVIPIHVTRP